MSKSIEYNVVKSEDIASAMKASAGSTKDQRGMIGKDAIVWNQTVTIAMERVDLKSISRDTSKDGIQKIGKELKKIMATHIMATIEIPLQGKNRKGELFDVQDDKGNPKWMSWDQTRRIFAYLGDIAKVIAFEKEDILYPESMKVGARVGVLKECKVKETPLAAIDRLSGQLQDNLDVMKDTKDVLHAFNAVNNLAVNNLMPVVEASSLIHRLDAIMGIMEKNELDTTRDALTVLTKYFKNV